MTDIIHREVCKNTSKAQLTHCSVASHTSYGQPYTRNSWKKSGGSKD